MPTPQPDGGGDDARQNENDKFGQPRVNHVLAPGHRIRVQVQSSLFPLYDRNPQTHVSSIFEAKARDDKPATRSVAFGPGQAGAVWLPVMQKERRRSLPPAPINCTRI